MNVGIRLAEVARTLAGRSVFNKRLPSEFGGAGIKVTGRSDIRLLLPGFHHGYSDLLQVASSYIKIDSCVWDVGSNLGLFAFCSSWTAGAGGKVYSLEADPFYVELQNSTIKSLPSGYAPVTPLCAAASDQLGVLDLSLPRRGHTRNHLTIVEGNDAGETESHKCVVSVTADFLLQYWPKPDFVKVDIEGSELLFLRGATKLLSEARPTLYIEVSELNSSAASKVLSSFDYGLFTLLPDGSEVREESCKFNSLARPLEET